MTNNNRHKLSVHDHLRILALSVILAMAITGINSAIIAIASALTP